MCQYSKVLVILKTLNKALTFFLNRPGGTVTYNDTKYISEYCEESITELLQAYEKMRYEDEDDSDYEEDDMEEDSMSNLISMIRDLFNNKEK